MISRSDRILSIDPATAKPDAYSVWDLYPEPRLIDFGHVDSPVELLDAIDSCAILCVEDQYMHNNFKTAKQLITQLGTYRGLFLGLGKDESRFRVVNVATWQSKAGVIEDQKAYKELSRSQRTRYKKQRLIELGNRILCLHGFDHDIDDDIASAILIGYTQKEVI